MNQDEVVVSVDIGGSKARGVVVSWPSRLLRRFSIQSKNFRAMVDLELAEFLLKLGGEVKAAGTGNSGVWYLGAAGARLEPDARRIGILAADLSLPCSGIRIYRDFEANHAAAFGGGDGVLSVNGTGSVLFARSLGKAIRRGGWGFHFDEMPSGAAFGRWALQGVLSGFEGYPEGEVLLKLYRQGFPDAPRDKSDLIDLVYSSSTPQRLLGEFAPLLASAFDMKCPFAIGKIRHSFAEWKKALASLSGMFSHPDPLSLTGVGGLWEKWPEFPRLAGEELEKGLGSRLSLATARFSPEFGPLILSLLERGIPSSEWEPALERISR